ncbi:MAG: hypothetical protein U1E39_09675 [Planctomycetota bacterium]
MDATPALLRELIELQRQTIRLQKFQISLTAELVVYHSWAASKFQSVPALEKAMMATVQRMRKTVEKVAAGKALPK